MWEIIAVETGFDRLLAEHAEGKEKKKKKKKKRRELDECEMLEKRE